MFNVNLLKQANEMPKFTHVCIWGGGREGGLKLYQELLLLSHVLLLFGIIPVFDQMKMFEQCKKLLHFELKLLLFYSRYL